MDHFSRRRAALADSLAELEVGAILVTDPVNVRYLTGFTGSSGVLALTPSQAVLVSDGRYEEQIASEVDGVEVVIRPMTQKLPEAAGAALVSLGVNSAALEADHATLALREVLGDAAPAVNFKHVRGAVQKLREVKDESEIARIREAVRVAEQAFEALRSRLRGSDTEKVLADTLDNLLRRGGARGSAFAPIVAAGARGALPHATPTGLTLAEGGILLIDWGADLEYKSDLTRSFRTPFGPDSGEHDFEALFDAVNRAHEAAANSLRAGVAAKDVDRAARAVLERVPLKNGPAGATTLSDVFTHGLGHGLGLEVHEAPDLRSSSGDVLEAGMVVTIEPGVYLPGWGGIRLEDDYLVTEGGSVRLSTLPRGPGLLG